MRVRALASVLALLTLFLASGAARAAEAKVLRLMFVSAETTFDPAKVIDVYSNAVNAHIFESPYGYDPLARPARVRPLTAEAMPEASADLRTWTIRIRAGIYFADDPAFKGARRELVAQDYVYSWKRVADPANKSPTWGDLEDAKIVGLAALRKESLDQKKPFDYDREIEGLRALDRYTLQITVEEPRPRLILDFARTDVRGAVAREVIEAYGDKIGEHPVGTGPFKLKQWRRSSKIVLERNPGYRERFYEAEPAADDAQGQAILARLKGRRLPMVDEVHVAIIDEQQPQYLAFLNGQLDALASKQGPLPISFAQTALPNGRLAPNLARRGIVAHRTLNADMALTLFNMDDPVVGGYEAHKVALRRAIGLALDTVREAQLVRRGQAVPAQSPVLPHTSGYDPQFKTENGDHDPARAKALLDTFGYQDRDGDGWREQPDGSPLTLQWATEPEQINRLFNELYQKNLNAVGLRTRFIPNQWPENQKSARAGKLMMWTLGSSATTPDGQGSLVRWYSKQVGSGNLARFRLPAFDVVYERLSSLPDGPERDAAFAEAKRLAVAYAPYKVHVHRMGNDLLHPWVHGFRRPLFWNEWWHVVDVDMAARRAALGQ
jgi:ABC-type transport system substrate-binding protein